MQQELCDLLAKWRAEDEAERVLLRNERVPIPASDGGSLQGWPETRQQYRCPCCGQWLWCWKVQWQRRGREIFYCEGCSYERTGHGKNRCAYYREYPEAHTRWDDPKPDLPRLGFAVCR